MKSESMTSPKFDLQTLLQWVLSLQYKNLWQTFPPAAINIGYLGGQEGYPSRQQNMLQYPGHREVQYPLVTQK